MDIDKFSSWENYTVLWADHAWNNRCYSCFMAMSVENIGRKKQPENLTQTGPNPVWELTQLYVYINRKFREKNLTIIFFSVNVSLRSPDWPGTHRFERSLSFPQLLTWPPSPPFPPSLPNSEFSSSLQPSSGPVCAAQLVFWVGLHIWYLVDLCKGDIIEEKCILPLPEVIKWQ